MEKEKQYTIGQVAKLCNISTDQLRHYDKKEILSPNGRGRDNQYRYYTEEQIEDVLLLKTLKRVGLPLKQIAELLRDKNISRIEAVLKSNLLRQRKELREKQKLYDELEDLLMGLNRSLQTLSQREQQDFSIIPIAERPIIFIRKINSYSAKDSFLLRYTELLKLIEDEKLRTSQSLYLLFHEHYRKQFVSENALGDMEFFANITETVKNSVHYRMFGGFLAACGTHVGHYRDTEKLYRDLEAWAKSRGHKVAGMSFQELIVNRTMTNREEDFITNVYLPLDVEDI